MPPRKKAPYQRYMLARVPVVPQTASAKGYAHRSTASTRIAKLERKVLKDSHYFQFISTPAPVTVAGATNGLIGISQGDSTDNREGNRVMIDSITINYSWDLDPTQVQHFNYVRFVLVVDKQPNGVLAGLFDVLNNPTYPWLSTAQTVNKDRFRILVDRRQTLNRGGKECLTGTVYYRFKRALAVVYDGTATIPTTNNLIFGVVTDNPITAPTFTAISMARFSP